MKKIIAILTVSILLVVFLGYSILEKKDNKEYDVDDYKIIEIYYGDAIDQELRDQLKDSRKTKDLIYGAEEETTIYKGNRMCDSKPEKDGYRMLNQRSNKYLVSELNKGFGFYDGKNTYCSDISHTRERPGDDEPKRMRELADIFMSETDSEITDIDELNKYTQLLNGKDIHTSYGITYGILNIKFVNEGTTKLVRIYEVYEDDGSPFYEVHYIQITLSNDTDKFDKLYDEMYQELQTSQS